MKQKQPHGPMNDMLSAAVGTTRFHMPGHKGVLDPYDVTELARTDDLYAPFAGIAEAERLAAEACGAAHTLMLTGGSTAGLMAMILSSVAPGEVLLAPRRVHHAVLSACVWGGIDAVFFEGSATDAIAAHPKARAILVTRPDYYGICLELAPIVQAACAAGMLVLVDEAHGAHFAWWDSPQSAGALGADAWVQSAHKTLPALTGGAWLHLNQGMDAARARRFLRMVQTSSPPFPILQALDEARVWMDAYGRATLAELCAQLGELRAKIDATEGYQCLPVDDPTRLVIGTRGRGYTGMELDDLLQGYFIDVEMSDDTCIVCICTVADRPQALSRLFAGLRAIPAREPLPPLDEHTTPQPGPRHVSLREAALGAQEAVPLEAAAGRVIAVSAGMYPPGIPYALPGEEVSPACVAKLMSLPPTRRFGVETGHLICVK